MKVFNDNYKLTGIASGIANAAQPHALNIAPSGGILWQLYSYLITSINPFFLSPSGKVII